MSAPDPDPFTPSATQQSGPAIVSPPNDPPPAASAPVPPPTTTEQNEVDPAVAPLVAMFPDFDPSVLEAVYLSNNKDQNAAIEALLSMTNPEYQPSAQQVQSDADAELARQLVQEELSQARGTQARAHAWQAQQQQVPQRYSGAAPMQTPQTPPGGDNNFQEQFNKFAETGKRTLSTIFTKVKEKFKEFEQPQGSQQHPSGGSYGQYQPHPHSQQHFTHTQTEYSPMVMSPYPATNPPVAPPPNIAPARAHAPQGEEPARSYLSEVPSPSPPKGADQPAPKSPPIAVISASGASSSDAAGATGTESSGSRPSLELSKAAFLAKKPTPLTERRAHNIDDDLTENPFEDQP